MGKIERVKGYSEKAPVFEYLQANPKIRYQQ